ncbi:hypothetical protein PGT21_029898 [Puccinia graminis f. sp. tritici]|uniref:Uncharacterized protein n=1 Tax=Puccinia graminis f. sp. tritici TaxID=56615 RepID=A0A5B0QZ33_PUCGR|nr:hypothetical protein PGT21_029898 [Puccinia graminis f. sp. tritici]
MDRLQNGRSIRLTRSVVAQGRSWHLDAVNGGLSSMAILVTWLSTPGNYERWLSTPISRNQREEFCTEIVEIMQQHGIHHRNPIGKSYILHLHGSRANPECELGINNRIQVIRRSYNTARDFVNHVTRAGEEVYPIVFGV